MTTTEEMQVAKSHPEKLTEHVFLKVALEQRAESYRQMTETIIDHIAPITRLLEQKIKKGGKSVKWSDIVTNAQGRLALTATVPVAGSTLKQRLSITLTEEILDALHDVAELSRLVDAIPLLTDEPTPEQDIAATIKVEGSELPSEDDMRHRQLSHLVDTLGFDISKLEHGVSDEKIVTGEARTLTTDQLKMIVYATMKQNTTCKH